MKGEFSVQEAVDRGTLGVALRGSVISGSLKRGMEARSGHAVIIISELAHDEKEQRPLKRAKRGDRLLLCPLPMVYDVLKRLEGEVLLFEDERSLPVATLQLRPNLTSN